MPIELDVSNYRNATIRVIGVGGAGGNAVRTMISRGLEHVDFITANTDNQALMKNPAPVKIILGASTTRGLGAGSNPDVGRAAVEENVGEVRDALDGSDMVFITAGMGGGTGTGAAPVVASVARELGALVVAIVTTPFSFENKQRASAAERGIKELRECVDALIVIPNDRIVNVVDASVPFTKALELADEVLYNATKGIADIILNEGIVNVDFADVVTVMRNQGDALMGIGVGSGERRVMEAAQNALNSPILEGMSIWGAKGLLVNVTGGESLTLHEVNEAASCIQKAAGEDAHMIYGVVTSPDFGDEVSVTVIATGFTREGTEVVPAVKSTSVVAHQATATPAREPIPITVVTTPSEPHAHPILPAPSNIDTSDIEVPTAWRKSKTQSSVPQPAPAITRRDASASDYQQSERQPSSEPERHSLPSVSPMPAEQAQPEAFPRQRARASQAGGGGNVPAFLRKIMD